MTQLEHALQIIQTCRAYTLKVVESIAPGDWFRQPAEGITHIAWQVGHIAAAQYYLGLVRIRGERPEDARLITPAQLQMWGKGSTPDPDPAKNPSAEETLAIFHRVYEQMLSEIRGLTDAQLDETILKPHRLFTKKYDSLLWVAHHEFIHVGQIGLLRRLFGAAPLFG
ncbi:MAG: DinB family protein [Planctomycetia bacterium]|nr:DinB family protein [Planctomycetia bacterium]